MRIMLLFILYITLAALSGTAFSAETGQPNLTKTTYFVTKSASFSINANGARYNATLALRIKPKYTMYATVRYENPADPSNPLLKDFTIARNEKLLNLQSDYIKRIQRNRLYLLSLTVYKDPARTELVSEHKQQVLFRAEPELVKKFGLELIGETGASIK
jgi:hypothetical protein